MCLERLESPASVVGLVWSFSKPLDEAAAKVKRNHCGSLWFKGVFSCQGKNYGGLHRAVFHMLSKSPKKVLR